MLKKITRTAWLLDFYGNLLTKKQKRIMEYYYHQDLSLGEIAELTGVSRQAVHDLLRRAHNSLEDYEAKLGCLARYFKQQEQIDEIKGLLAPIKLEEETRKRILEILEGLTQLG